MKHKFWLGLLTSAVLVTAAIGLAACGGGGGTGGSGGGTSGTGGSGDDDPPSPPQHTHTFSDKWSADEEFHWHDATCTDTDEQKDRAKHDYVNGVCGTCKHAHENHNFANGACTVCGFRSDYTDDIIYEEDGDECFVTGIESLHESVVIPARHNGKTVTQIMRTAFAGFASKLVHVEIPDTVYWIEKGTFDSCSALAYETYGKLSYLGNYCMGCTEKEVSSVSMKPTTTGIYNAAFENCRSLTSIVVPDSCVTIQNNAFKSCSGLTSVTLGKNLRFVMSDAFRSDFSIKTVRYTGSVADWCGIVWYNSDSVPFCQYSNYGIPMGVEDFYIEGQLAENIVVPADVTSINDYTFYNCSTIKSISLPGVTEIGESAFVGCENLATVTLGNGLKSIKKNAFTETGLNAIDVPDSVTELGLQVFDNCRELVSAKLGKGVATIPWGTFNKCVKLSDVTLSEGLETIDQTAFIGCKQLTEITFPASLRTIGVSAFQNTGLQEVNIPAGATTIGEEAFSECGSLVSVVIGEDVVSVGQKAFWRCSALETVEIGKSVAEIGASAFDCDGLNKSNETLRTINVAAENESFFSKDGVLYKKDTNELIKAGRGIAGKVEIPEGVTQIPDRAFSKRKNLTEVILPASLTRIEERAFEATALQELTIPASDVAVVAKAFASCNILRKVYLAGGKPVISSDAFDECFRLAEVWNHSDTTVTIGSEVAKYAKFIYTGEEESKQYVMNDYFFLEDGENAWLLGYYGKETALTLPSASKAGKDYRINSHAFQGDGSIVSVQIPAGVSEIGEYAFSNCGALESVKFATDSRLTEIDSFAFEYTYSLESIRIPDGVSEINDWAFRESGIRLFELGKNSKITGFSGTAFVDCWALESIVLPETFLSVDRVDDLESLSTIYFYGSKETWDKRPLASKIPVGVQVYFFSQETPTEEQWTAGDKWWHYGADGSPTLWTK